MTTSSPAQSKPQFSLGIEVNDKNQYRVIFLPLHINEGESINKFILEPVSIGLSPLAAKIYVKNKEGENVNCSPMDGYSSAGMCSDLFLGKDKFEPLTPGRHVYSPWLSIEDLLRGFKHCTNHKAEDWDSFKIAFSIELSSLRLSVESDWYRFDIDFLKQL